MSGINEHTGRAGEGPFMEMDLDIETIARWAVSTYGPKAVPIIRRCAAANLMADDPEAAECWKRVAEAADKFLCSQSVH